MVHNGLPEPDLNGLPEQHLSMNETGENILITTNSDSDDEIPSHDGYELLNTIPTDSLDSEDSDDESVDYNIPASNLEDITTSIDEPGSSQDLKEVWSTPRESTNIVMDAEHVDQVKAAMASFTLPSSSIPSWAANVTEDQWKDRLMNRLKTLEETKAKN